MSAEQPLSRLHQDMSKVDAYFSQETVFELFIDWYVTHEVEIDHQAQTLFPPESIDPQRKEDVIIHLLVNAFKAELRLRCAEESTVSQRKSLATHLSVHSIVQAARQYLAKVIKPYTNSDQELFSVCCRVIDGEILHRHTERPTP